MSVLFSGQRPQGETNEAFEYSSDYPSSNVSIAVGCPDGATPPAVPTIGYAGDAWASAAASYVAPVSRLMSDMPVVLLFTFGLLNPPANLGPLGAPGCIVHPDTSLPNAFAVGLPLPDASGQTSWSTTFPDDPSLYGVQPPAGHDRRPRQIAPRTRPGRPARQRNPAAAAPSLIAGSSRYVEPMKRLLSL